MAACKFLSLLIVYSFAVDVTSAQGSLPFLPLGVTPGVEQIFLAPLDDGASDAITIPGGFPFGEGIESVVYVGTNGYISFRRAVTNCCPSPFPNFENLLVAPYWGDNDIRLAGNVSYEVHTGNTGHLQTVNNFISAEEGTNFTGTWMLLVAWNETHPWPHGDGTLDAFTQLANTYQAVLVTDNILSYTVFIYECDLIEWTDPATIGYHAEGGFFINHPLTGSSFANEIDCQNFPQTVSNVLYQLHPSTDMPVVLSTDPPGPVFPAATYINFFCIPPMSQTNLTYSWSLFCPENPTSIIDLTLPPTTNSIRVWSTAPFDVCISGVSCTVSDSIRPPRTTSFIIANVTGVGLFGDSEPLLNNSALTADVFGEIGVIHCHTASREALETSSQWHSPAGIDITRDLTDDFQIQRFSGLFPSFTSLELLTGLSLSAGDQGVYSCALPDENGIEQILFIGLFREDYDVPISVSDVEKLSQDPLTLNCITTGLPATAVFWLRGDSILVSDDTYSILQTLRDGITSTYDNFLTINEDLLLTQGLYRCFAFSDRTSQSDGANITTTSAVRYFTVNTIGGQDSITCSNVDADRVEWIHNGDVVAQGLLGEATLDFPLVNDSVHGRLYTCRQYAFFFFLIEELNLTTIVNVPSTIIMLSIEVGDTMPVLGEAYSIECIAIELREGLSNRSSLAWLDSSGQLVVAGDGVSLTSEEIPGEASLILQFDALRTSQAQEYTCLSILNSPALTEPLNNSTRANVTVQLPTPTVVIIQPPDTVLVTGSSATLVCRADLDEVIDTAVAVTVIWRRSGVILSGDDRIVISGPEQSSPSHYESNLTICPLGIQDSREYSCEVIVEHQPISPFIIGNTGSATTNITVTASSLLVTASPVTSVDVINVEPHNTFSIMCTATASDSVTVPKSFLWERVLQGTSASETVSDDGDSVTIVNINTTSPASISTLTVRENTAGNYTYTCTATLQTLPGDPVISGTSSIDITVRGPVLPLPPVFVNGVMTDTTSYQIDWEIVRIAYTPESYVVMYGTSADTLDLTSETINGNGDITSINERFSVVLRNLDHDTTFYFEIIATNLLGSTPSELVMFTTETALLVTVADTGFMNAGSLYTVTCTVTDTIVGTSPTVVWLDPLGQELPNSATDVVVQGPITTDTITTIALVYNPLRASNAGDYTCRAHLETSGTINITESQIHAVNPIIIDIPVSITITSTPMPEGSEYQAASSVTLTCEIDDTGTFAPLTYQWTSTCLGDCFVRDQTSPVVSREGLRSIDAGSHTCTVTDDVGNTGSASIEMIVTGVGLFHTGSGRLSNNSIVIADSVGRINDLQCISASTTPSVGCWIAPNGENITFTTSDPFDVTIGGQNNPGYLRIAIVPGESLGGLDEGVYACVIPDETGVEQTIHVGIYLNGFNTPVAIDSLERRDASIFTLSCTTSGSPPTTVVWVKDGSTLVNDRTFQITQRLRDGITSTYESLLMVIGGPNAVTGTYTCTVNNDLSSATTETIILSGLQIIHSDNIITGATPLVFIVNSAQTISCSTDLDVIRLEWRRGMEVIDSSSSQELDIVFDPVNDTIHNAQYTCMTSSPYGDDEQDIVIHSQVLPSHINISISTDSETVFAGQPFSLVCEIHQAEGLTSQQLDIEWQDSLGNPVTEGGSVSILGPVRTGTRTTLTLEFDPLQLVHSEAYSCHAMLTTTAPPFQFERDARLDVIVMEPLLNVEVTPPSTTACQNAPFNEFTLTCNVTLSNPVTLEERIEWRRGPQDSEVTLADDGSNIIILSNLGNPTSISVLTVSNQAAGINRYVCVAMLDFPDSEGIQRSASAEVTIKAIQAPAQPTALDVINIGRGSATVVWTIPNQSCAPEEYVVQYGLNPNSLDEETIGGTGTGDPSLRNMNFSVQLTGLREGTLYHYMVVALNDVRGSTRSELQQFTTLEPERRFSVAFQLVLRGTEPCTEWRSDRAAQRMAEIADMVREMCSCSIAEGQINSGRFDCPDDNNDQTIIFFRAVLSGPTQDNRLPLLSALEDWVESGVSLLILGETVIIDSTCQVPIDSLNAPVACNIVPRGDNGGVNAAVIGGIVAAVIVVIIVVIILFCCVARRSKLKRQRQGETAVGYYNPGIDNEQIIVGMGDNPAYDDASKWLKSTAAAEPWPRRPTAESNPYHGAQKAKGSLPPPPYEEKQTLPGDGAFFIVQNPIAETPQPEPVYEKTLAEYEDEEDYPPIVLTTDTPTVPGLSRGSPLEVETPLSTYATLEPRKKTSMPADPDEWTSSGLDPSADTDSMKFDVEENSAYQGRKDWTSNGEDTPVESPQSSPEHGDYNTPHSRHNWLSSSAVANYLPPDLEGNLMGKITPTSFGGTVEQQEEPLMSTSMSTDVQPKPKPKEYEQPLKLDSKKQSPQEDKDDSSA